MKTSPWVYVGRKFATVFGIWVVIDGLYIHKDNAWYAILIFGLGVLGILYDDACNVEAYKDKVRQLERRVEDLEKQLGVEKKQ